MTDNQDSKIGDAVQPPTDWALTAGEPLWMVHVLGPDEIYPAPDHATAVQWCAGMNGAIPGSDVLCVAVPALWTGSSQSHAAGLKDARDDFAALSRPATSAASEVEGGLDAIRSEIEEALDRNGLAERGWTQKAIDEAIAAVPTRSRFSKAEAGVVMPIIERHLATLASPPVSERERELEGALRLAREYIERFSDVVDGDYGAPDPNEAMQLVHAIDQAVGDRK